eukprot:7871353-Heterocapsa_arctica.AAC.1
MLLEQPGCFAKTIKHLLRAPQTSWLGGGRSKMRTERGMGECGVNVVVASEPLFASAVASGEPWK